MDAGLIYEHAHKAIGTGDKGYPTFLSARKVLKKDLPTLDTYVEECLVGNLQDVESACLCA